MLNFCLQFFSLFILVSLILFLTPAGVGGQQIRIENPLKAQSFQELLLNIADFIFTLAIPVVLIMIIIGGFMFITATGDLTKIQQARQLLLWTIIGFLVILLSKGLIQLIQDLFIR
jgi:D-alanyl-lipoteichoic acid acyltransferase DltB (MBOAT superfamily)